MDGAALVRLMRSVVKLNPPTGLADIFASITDEWGPRCLAISPSKKSLFFARH